MLQLWPSDGIAELGILCNATLTDGKQAGKLAPVFDLTPRTVGRRARCPLTGRSWRLPHSVHCSANRADLAAPPLSATGRRVQTWESAPPPAGVTVRFAETDSALRQRATTSALTNIIHRRQFFCKQIEVRQQTIGQPGHDLPVLRSGVFSGCEHGDVGTA